ncbi:uncharacterized protein LTR77_003336 [Saxophila tyrrhenica]|uniref:Uncharacterized protein n=1 Tax=Saxophila tyrrhenica TaxID=1690608 RepID=A0AAV9PE34_9PEZI|nr:hypothetical protein LTR77_003336 [Saxophila tyrrhenica]
MASRTDARFSTYSGAPSLQPSLAPTYDSAPSAHYSQTTSTYLSPNNALSEKRPYDNPDPAAATSTSTLNSNADPKAADIKSWSGALERMQDERLDKQRYTMSSNKSDEVSKLALGAKVERALARRMVGQDAVFSPGRGKKGGFEGEKARKPVEAN